MQVIEFRDSDDIEQYNNILGVTYPNTGENKNTATKSTVEIGVLDTLGNSVDRSHDNPLLDTREYEMNLEDENTDRYFANVIAKNLSGMCDAEGNQYEIFKKIIDNKNNAQDIPIFYGYDIRASV